LEINLDSCGHSIHIWCVRLNDIANVRHCGMNKLDYCIIMVVYIEYVVVHSWSLNLDEFRLLYAQYTHSIK